MRNYLCYILFAFLFIPFALSGDTIPIEGQWSEKDLRSLSPSPFTVEKEGNTLSICSNKTIEDVYIRIVSAEGAVYCEDLYEFSAYEPISISLNSLPVGNYFVEIFHSDGYLSGEFINP